MIRTSSNILALLLLVAVAISSGCGKRKANRETTSAKDDNIAETMFDDVFKNVEEAQDEELEGEGKTFTAEHTFGDCATIDINGATGEWPKTLSIDFGTTGCEGSDGKVRKGVITAVYSGPYRETGSTVTITPSNYYVDNYLVEGSKVVTNLGNNADNQLQFRVDVDGTVTTPDGDEIAHESTRTRTWVEGQNTGFFTVDGNGQWMGLDGILDDVWEITGNGSGTNREGRDYTVNITNPLRVEWCGYRVAITSGTIDLVPDELKTRTIDFGSGACDEEFTVTIGNKEYTVSSSGS